MKLAYNFSDYISSVRKERKLTQIEVIKVTGLTRSTLSFMESHGKGITLDNMEKWLKGMNLTLSDFHDYLNRNS